MFGLFGNKASLSLRDKATDPVCKMKVDKKTQYFSDYQGSKYFFCSENCQQQFNAEPKKYAAQESAPAKSCCH